MPQPPVIKPMSLDHLILPRPVAMPNGVPLYLLEGVDKGVVRFDILFNGGYAVQSKPLLAMFTNRMLREGAGELSAAEISQKLDYYGAWIDMYSSQNSNHITLYTMSKHFVPLLNVLEEMIKRPLFPQENLDTVKSNNKSYFISFNNTSLFLFQKKSEQAFTACSFLGAGMGTRTPTPESTRT